ncbi:MAG: VanW family protein [Candidatus Magasanikbacteria bacterium]|nr:VanW family protein [Candidatus Magasanikbacteria bacterium]
MFNKSAPNFLPAPPPRASKLARRALLAAAVMVPAAVFIIVSYVVINEGKIYPGVRIGALPVGGLTETEARGLIEQINNRYATAGIDLIVRLPAGAAARVKLSTVVAGDSTVDLIALESAALAREASSAGRGGHWAANLFAPWRYRLIAPRVILPRVTVNAPGLAEVLQATLHKFADPPRDARLDWTRGPSAAAVIAEKSGTVFNYSELIAALQAQLANFSFAPLIVTPRRAAPAVTAALLEAALPALPGVFAAGNLPLSYVHPVSQARQDWTITPDTFRSWLTVRRDRANNVLWSLDPAAVAAYLNQTVRPAVEIPARDAKFVKEADRVREFQGSQSGRVLNREKTGRELISQFEERNYRSGAASLINVAVDLIEPAITTADVNELGISEVLGIGISTYRGSHRARIKNIERAVERLNGVLIKPGEEFSANRFAGPYTAANGYLPEMVIKGREIKPEIGGGMCQIGTTLFRMAMKAGMPITERFNHSLVVSYYADPVNKNPGTDATLYEPQLDFKFLNDTGSYLLLETRIDYERQELQFILWGKPDGRRGSYTHPVVSRWIPSGEPQEIVATDGSLKPGQQKCQNAFRGAVASFTYTRLTPAGEKIDRVFESFYRPLPKICMVGASASSTPADRGSGEETLPGVE